MNTSLAQTQSLYLGHFDLILASLDMASLNLKWKKSRIDASRYDLEGPSQGAFFSVWKSGGRWGTLSGASETTLKAAKEKEELRLRGLILEELEGLEVYLRAFDVHARSVYAVKGEAIHDTKRYCLSTLAYRALHVILGRLVTSWVEVVLKRFPEIQSARTNHVLASALTGFDMGDLKLMFVEPRIAHGWNREGAKNYALHGESIVLPVSTLVNSSQVMEDHPGFCDYKSLSITQLSETALIRQLDSYIEQTFRVAQAVAG